MCVREGTLHTKHISMAMAMAMMMPALFPAENAIPTSRPMQVAWELRASEYKIGGMRNRTRSEQRERWQVAVALVRSCVCSRTIDQAINDDRSHQAPRNQALALGRYQRLALPVVVVLLVVLNKVVRPAASR